jgi:23S rRNA maturation-related 3'-5' exoribonuclease YhaM
MELAEVAAYKQFSDVHALVLRKSVGKTAKDIPYADFTLQHDQVSLSCKKWNYDVAKYDHILKEGAVVKVSGSGDLYRGSLQGTVVTIEPSDRAAIDFAKKSRFNLIALYQNLLDVAKGLEDPMLSYVSLTLLTQYKEDFCRSPAASGMHHA